MDVTVWLTNESRITLTLGGDAIEFSNSVANQLKEGGVVIITDEDGDCFVIPRERIDHFSIFSNGLVKGK